MPGSDQHDPTSADEPASRSGARRSQRVARRLIVPVLLVAVLLPYAVTLLALWSRTGSDLDRIRQERAGVVAVRPLVTLLAATADAQSAAVAGARVDGTSLRSAMAAMDAADAEVGVALAVDRRWADVRSRLSHLISTSPRGTEAYPAFSQVIDLELALLVAVGDSSGLRVDPAVDSHYLMDATVLRIPEILVAAGRISDLTLLVEQRKAPVMPDTLVVGVAESELRTAVSGLDDGLRKGFGATTSRTLGPALLGELDRLRDAAAQLAPPLQAVGGSPTERRANATEAARRQVRGAALQTASSALIQLVDLLEARQADVDLTRRTVAGATAAGLLAALGVVWFAAPRRRPELDSGTSGPDAGTPSDSGLDVLDPDSSDLLEARELLEARQLIRVGRAVAPRRQDSGPPAEEDT